MPLDKVDPSPLWKWWDAFEIKSAEMRGYWMADCPVKTSHPAVKATAYMHPGRRMAIAVASWASEAVNIRLDIDWQAIRLNPDAARITIPKIRMFQNAMPAVSLESLP